MGRSWKLLKCSLKKRRAPSDGNTSRLLVDNARAELEVPKKHFAVRVGANAKQYVVPVSYISIPSFRALMDKSIEVFGSQRHAPLLLPCEEEAFEELLMNLEQPQKCRLWRLWWNEKEISNLYQFPLCFEISIWSFIYLWKMEHLINSLFSIGREIVILAPNLGSIFPKCLYCFYVDFWFDQSVWIFFRDFHECRMNEGI